jgi:signal transduction histidine kinase
VLARLRRKLAWQFTLIVFTLMILAGAAYLAVDYFGSQHSVDRRLEREAQRIAARLERGRPSGENGPPLLRGGGERARLVDAAGHPLEVGESFPRVTLPLTMDRFATVRGEGGYLRVLTVPVDVAGAPAYLQVVTAERVAADDLPWMAALFALVCVVVSGLTYLLGYVFAGRSLRPAEETLARLEQFTHDASHELRTPLTAIRSSLDCAVKTGDYETGIRDANEELDRAALLVDRLLDLARLDAAALELEQVDLGEVVAEAVLRQREIAAAQGVAVSVHAEGPVALRADRTLLSQLVGNLLRNAIKFNHPGGAVDITLRRSELSVGDTGVGMTPEEVSRVFERFYQSDASRAEKGFGLGLPLVRRIAELHEWTVRVDSSAGNGTTVRVVF